MEQPAPGDSPVHKRSDAKILLLVILAVVVSAIATLIYHNRQDQKRRVDPSEEGFDLKEQAELQVSPSTAPAARTPNFKPAQPPLKR